MRSLTVRFLSGHCNVAVVAALSAPFLFGISSAASAQADRAPSATMKQSPLSSDLVRSQDTSSDDIIVTAKRYGEAKVAAETEFDEDEIASHGAGSIQELIDRVKPFISNGAEEPVLLVNGRPLGGDPSLMSYPAEALDRLAVLKPEAAAQYGFSSGKRVVNLVLKQTFSSLNVDGNAGLATGGGQYGGGLSVGRVAINGPVRWNAQATINHDGPLMKSARNIRAREEAFDAVGYVAAVNGLEIDPALSRAAGEVVKVAAIPLSALSQAPGLADFVSTANMTHASHPGDFETLLSSRSSVSFMGGVTVPLGDFSTSLNLSAGRSQSRGLRGSQMASIVISADSLWSPFANDVVLTRPFAGDRPLRVANNSKSLGMSFILSGMINGWQSNLFVHYSRSWSDDLLERGIDTIRMQKLLDAGDPALNPYGPLDEGLLLGDRNHSRSENLNAGINISKAVVELPAGPLTTNFSVDVSRYRSESWGGDLDDMTAGYKQSRVRINGQVSFNMPLSRKGGAEIGSVGDLAIDLLLSGQAMSGSGPQKRFVGGLNWSPFSVVQLHGSLEYAETTPSFEQLDGPLITTINRVFDFTRQEAVDVIKITGGNPNLNRGNRHIVAFTARLLPLDDQALTLNLGYREQNATGGLAPFPDLTPVIEAAFPERVIREVGGRLVGIDARSINISHDVSTELTSGIALRFLRRRAGAYIPSLRLDTDPWQFSVSLNHRWRLKNELLIRRGVPSIDQLGDEGGQSRHFLSLQMTAGKRGIGASLNGNWSSVARVRIGAFEDAEQVFRSKPPTIFNLSAFVELEHILAVAAEAPWIKHLKFSLEIQNVLNGYREVTLGDGSVPRGYSRDEIDPLGRTVRLTVRKRF